MTRQFTTCEAAEGPVGSRFSADGVAIVHLIPFKSFKGVVTEVVHAHQAKRSLCGVMVTGPSTRGRGEGV